jgi:methyl-accepting chemotaxis protein
MKVKEMSFDGNGNTTTEPREETYPSDISAQQKDLQNLLSECSVVLHLTAQNDYTKHVEGNYQGIHAEIAESINAVQDRLLHVQKIMVDISKGDFSELESLKKIGKRSENDKLVPSFITMMEGTRAVVDDVNMLAEAGKDGQLAVRADASKHNGEFAKVVEGVNQLMDAVGTPIEGVIQKIELIGKGKIPERVTREYGGEFNRLKNSLNACIDELKGLEEGNAVLQRVAQNDYTKRVEGNYEGIYAEIAESINTAQVHLLHAQKIVVDISKGDLEELEILRKMGKQSENDQLIPSYILMMEAIQALVKDMEMLAKAGREGKLAVRADASKHNGEYAKVVEGVNQLMDAVVAPVNEAMQVSGKFAVGDYTVRFSDKIAVDGDFQKFKESLNEMAEKTSAAVTQIKHAADQMHSGVTDASKGADEIAKAAEQVAITSQKCADLNRNLLSQMEEIEHRISDLSASNEEMASTSQEVLEHTLGVTKQGSEAKKLGNEANTKMVMVQKIAEESVKGITELTAEMHEINKIVKLITDISNQTNLLALNAAIEAARAGEHGRGFAVVAGEVRNLAGESKKATNDIEDLITSIQAKSEKTAQAIKMSHDEIAAGVTSVTQTIEALNIMVKGTEQATIEVGEIAKAIEDQANTSNAVVQIVNEGTKLTKETMKQVSDLAALAEETSASTEEIGSINHELDTMATELQKDMKQFRV